MRWGCCGAIDDAAKVKAAGFDFLEVHIQQVLQGELDDAAWAKAAPDVDRLPLPIEAANCLLPAKLPVIGSGRDLATLKQYMQRVAKRARQVGIERLVFGSGAARKRPEDVSEDQAFEQLVEFTKIAGDAATANDVLIVIEHLNRKETNTVNSVAEARRLCDHASHPGVAVLVDSFHWGLEQESDQPILDLGDRLRHVHVAEPVERLQPGAHGSMEESDKAFDFVAFFCLLAKIGYDERVSIEAGWQPALEQAGPATLQLLRNAWTDAHRAE